MAKYKPLNIKDFTQGVKKGTIEKVSNLTPDIKFNITTKVTPRDLSGRFEKVNKAALQIARDELRAQLDEAMMSSVWGSTGDIYDTGQLMNSLSITIEGARLKVRYDTDYANLIHYGGYIRPYGNENANLVYIPGRPWVESVIIGGGPIPQFDFEGVYRRALNSVF